MNSDVLEQEDPQIGPHPRAEALREADPEQVGKMESEKLESAKLESAKLESAKLESAKLESAKLRQILDGARKVFLADGYDGASMNDIARAAGVSKGTLYVYFDSKEILLEAVIRDLKSAQVERNIKFDESAMTLEGNLRQSALQLSRLILQPEHIAIVRLVIGVAHKLPRIGQAFYESGPLYGRQKLSAYLDQLVGEGALEIADTDIAAGQFLQLAYSELINLKLFRMKDEMSEEDLNRAINHAMAMFMAAYVKKNAPANCQ